jgi:uncharacterized protein YjiK
MTTMPVRAALLLCALSAGITPAEGGPGPPSPTPVSPDSLQLVRVVPLRVREPSDMCLDRDGAHWWTVSDKTGLVYELCLSDGAVVQTLAYHGVDPEGIWQDPADGTFFVAEELTREIVHLDTKGRVLGRVTVAGLGGDANSGLEGVTSGPVTGSFFVTQEKNPARLVMTDSAGHILDRHEVSFVHDLSGVTHDPRTGQLVLVSDESHRVCWASPTGELVRAWDIPVTKAEGVAVDTARARVYVVSDREEKLYEFRLP